MSEATESEMVGVDVAGPEDEQHILFLHGAMFTRKMWAPQRELLSDAYRVVAPDLPGHGERADRDFRLEEAVSVVEEVVERETPGNVLLVGLSLGGYVATAYTSRHPEQVDGLVLSGSSVNPVERMEGVTRAVGKLSRLATRSERVENEVRKRAEQWVRNRDLVPEQTEEIVRSGFYPRQFGIAGRYIAGQDFRGMFGSYPGPALILNGERDLVMRRGEDAHAAAGQNARVEVITGVGHICNLHKPTRYADAIRRFDRHAVEAEQHAP